MRKSCAQPIYNLVDSSCITSNLIHKQANPNKQAVHKQFTYALRVSFLYPHKLNVSTHTFDRFLKSYTSTYTHYTQGLLTPLLSLNIEKI